MRLGIAYVPAVPPERLRSLVTTAEDAGLDELWVWEDCFKQSGIASAAVALAWTSSITVGIGLLPVPLRNVALTAMEVATLAGTAPGRLIAGLGHGVQDWMGQAGARVDSPMTLLEEYTSALRRMLAGERVSTTGRYVRLDDVQLAWPPSVPPPLMLGGTGPKSLALAAKIGDGNLLATAMSDAETRDACATIRASAVRDDHPIVATYIVATGPGAQDRLNAELPLWGKRPGAGIGIAGGPEEIAESLRALGRLGVTSVAVHPTADEPDLPGLVRVLGEQVRPLLQ